MFHQRPSDFGPSVTAIQQHLGAVEKELKKVGRVAGRRTSVAAAGATEQIGDAISTILGDMMDRFRQGRQMAGDQGGRLGNQALDLGAKYSNEALRRITDEIEDRPLITIGVALGIGILIGAAVLGSASARRR
ncbi:MAG: hypothetical protein WAK55_31325 [Xanthobacteraceae bacterium]